MKQTRRLQHLLAAVAVATLGLTGCTAGDWDPAAPPAAGVNVDQGNVKLRNLAIVVDDAGKGELTGAMVSSQPDSLTTVEGVAKTADNSEAGTLQVKTTQLELPASKLVNLSDSPIEMSSGDLRAGLNARLRFTFANSGSVELIVPVIGDDHPDFQKK